MASRTPAANRTTADDADTNKAVTDGRDNQASNDPDVRATTEGQNVQEGDTANLTEGQRIASHQDQIEAGRPGYHCGYCGAPVGPEGQHWDSKGNAVPGNHAGTMVVADNWPENQDEQDKDKREAEQADRDVINGVTEK